jgi:hypothetical protein
MLMTALDVKQCALFVVRDRERGRGDEEGLAVQVDAGEAFGIVTTTSFEVPRISVLTSPPTTGY